MEIITELTTEAEVGKSYMGKVKRIVNFGAFVEILPGLEGLLHVSEIAPYHVNDPHDELNEGDEIKVKVIDVDGDRVRLSRRALLADQGGEAGQPGGDPHGPKGGRVAAHSGTRSSSGYRQGGPPRERGERGGGGGRYRRRR